MRPKHYLLTIKINQEINLHTYLMTDDPRAVAHARDEMFGYIESNFGRIALPIILQTELESGASIVRNIICELNSSVKRTLAKSKRYHRTMFSMRSDHVFDRRLMDLH